MFNKISITVVLDKDEIDYLKEQSQLRRLSVSAVVREAIERMRQNASEPRTQS